MKFQPQFSTFVFVSDATYFKNNASILYTTKTINMKSRSLKLFLGVFLLSVSFIGNSFSQSKINASDLNEDWQLIKSEQGLNFYVSKQNCTRTEGQKPLVYAFMKIENTTSASVSANFSLALLFEEGCSGCTPDGEYTSSITIPAGSTVEQECSTNNNTLSRLIVNPNLSGGWKFTGVELMNLTIK